MSKKFEPNCDVKEIVKMCDCWQCNMTEEQQAEEAELYIEWEYDNYCKTTDNPLSIENWLKQFESPNQKENKK